MRTAIISQYYKSCNYGGNLQSYAMCKAIEKCGHRAEQICFTVIKKSPKVKKCYTLKKLKLQ